jgi:hypothetical protein
MKRSVFGLVAIALMLTTFQNCSGVAFNTQSSSAKNSTTGTTTPTTTPNFPPTTPPTNPVDANGCLTTLPSPTRTCRTYLIQSANTWKVPCDFNVSNNSVEAIGSGADGGGDVRAGGGGGAYSKSVNVTLVRGSTVAYSVTHFTMGYPLTGHSSYTDAGDSFLCNTNSGCASMASSGVVVGAQGGFGSVNNGAPSAGGTVDAIGGLGGQASSGIATGPGALKYNGGSGGNCQNNLCTANSHPGSGGGAAGPHGDGLAGGNTAAAGGAGDAGFGGAGGGDAGAGGNGTEWDATHGSGGGGGGASTSVVGGFGGSYGGGGGGSGTDQNIFGQHLTSVPDASGVGGQGLIVVTYQGSSCN